MNKKKANLIVLLLALATSVAYWFLFKAKGWPALEIAIQCLVYTVAIFILGWNNERFIKNTNKFDLKEDDRKFRLRFVFGFLAFFSIALFNQPASDDLLLKIIGGVTLLGSVVALRIIGYHRK